jgi:hypothetical protein
MCGEGGRAKHFYKKKKKKSKKKKKKKNEKKKKKKKIQKTTCSPISMFFDSVDKTSSYADLLRAAPRAQRSA